MKMKNTFTAGVFVLLGVAVSHAAHANVLERPEGIKIGQRMTLRPYVSLSLSYDSNVRSSHYGESDVMWMISPGLGLTYHAETWSLSLSGYYNYKHYNKTEHSDYNRHSYGEELRWAWSNSTGAEKGWSLTLTESFQQVTMSDDMTSANGRGYSPDSRQFQFSGALQRRFNEHWHATINSGYYWLDYQNNPNRYSSYYGWDRWMLGGEIGFAPSKWTDFILAGNYQGYTQDNALKNSYFSDNSQAISVQAGLGSYMTERISYRLLMGWSRFEYGDDADADNGFVYTASGNWKIGDTWNMMLLATSYYQPSERQYASSLRIDSLSWGLSKTMVRGKLRGTFDVIYRREEHTYARSGFMGNDYVLDVLTGRLGFDYNINRLLAFFVYGEYQKSWNDDSDSEYYDYDRWRLTTGFRLKY